LTNQETVTVIDDEGKEIECIILFTFDSEEMKNSYIVYTDDTVDEEGRIKVYASRYDPTGNSLELKPVDTEKEWKIIENILTSLQEEIKKSLRGVN